MPTVYKVKQGDCIDSIALEHGLFSESLWNDPGNTELKNARKDPNVLQPDDEVTIPDLEQKTEKAATEKKHSFRRKGIPDVLRLNLRLPVDDDEEDEDEPASPETKVPDDSSYEDPEEELKAPETEPVADTPYVVVIDGERQEGSTDGDGNIEITLPPNAQKGEIQLNPGTPEEKKIPLDLGTMDPVDSNSGARKRLNNLGFRCVQEGDEMSDDLNDALQRFQSAMDLETSGRLDKATQDKLQSEHGC